MEDAHACVLGDKLSVFGIYDGHGGDEAAIFTAQRLPELIAAHPTPVDPAALTQIMEDVDGEFLAGPDADGGSGSTCVTAVVESIDGVHFRIAIANAGDARALLITDTEQTKGMIKFATADHKPYVLSLY